MGRYDLTYKADHIAIFWLSRPDAKNAVNSEVSHQMHLLQEKFEADDDLWVGIVAAVRLAASWAQSKGRCVSQHSSMDLPIFCPVLWWSPASATTAPIVRCFVLVPI